MIFSCISDNVSSTVKSVIHFVQQVARYGSVIPYCRVHLDTRPNQPRHEIKRSDLWKYFSINVLCVIPFARSVHLDARQNQPQHEIKCGDFFVHFRQRIIHRQERYSFRATSCTLRERDSILSRASWYTTKSTTAWNKVRWFLDVFFKTTYY